MELPRAAAQPEAAPASEPAEGVRRVLFVTTTSDYGGAESLLERLVSLLDPRRFVPIFCSLCPLGEIGRRIAAGGVETLSLGMTAQPHPAEMIAAPFRLARLFDQHHIDLVHAQLYRANVLSALAARLARRRPAVVVAQHSLSPAKGRFASIAAWATRPLTATTIAVSDAVKERLADGWGPAPERVVVIQNGVDTERFHPRDGLAIRRELGLEPTVFVIGGVGRLSPVKGFDALLEAVAQLRRDGRETALVLVGDGPEHESLETQARSLGLEDAVRFLGVRHDLEMIYPGFDVFALPSLREASPMALLEAMACGCAIVASRVGGVPEMIEDGRSGLLFDRTAPGALTKALARLAENPGLRRSLGEEARRRSEERFSLAAVVHQHERLYRTILAGMARR